VTETQMLTMAAALVATMFGLLCSIIGWIGSRAINAIDQMKEKLNEVASELHQRINGLDRRITVVETEYSFRKGNRDD